MCVRALRDLFGLLETLHQGVPLRVRPLQLPLAGGPGPGTLGIHLLLEQPLALLLGLGAVDLWSPPLARVRSWLCPHRASTYVLNKSALVLEGVTLGQVVELVVEVLVDLAAGTVLDEEAAEDTLAAHPEDLATQLVSECPLYRKWDPEKRGPGLLRTRYGRDAAKPQVQNEGP